MAAVSDRDRTPGVPGLPWSLQMRMLSIVLAAAAALAFRCADAMTVLWPGSTCTSTLQACVEVAASGDEIRIATNTPIDEDIDLGGRSLVLGAATTLTATYQPRFAPGRSISATAVSDTAGVAITIENIRLVDGSVVLRYGGTGSADYVLRNLQLTQVDPDAEVGLRVGVDGGNASVTAYGNLVSGDPPAYGGSIELDARNASLNAYAAFNRIVHGQAPHKKSGILVDAGADSSGGTVRLFGNDIRLAGASSSGILFRQQPGTAATLAPRVYSNAIRCRAGSLARGIDLQAGSGTLDLQLLNNTIAACATGIYVAESSLPASPTFSGLVWNNLIVAESLGLAFTSSTSATLANDYNLINAPANQAASLGLHTIIAPAALDAGTWPRPGPSSPAIDAADAGTLANGIIDNGLPILDVDGLRRVNGTRADIGAYESGRLGFLHRATAANSGSHITTLDPHGLDAGANLFATRRNTPGIVNSYENFGVWYGFSDWTIYNEDHATAIVPGKAWNVFVPGAGAFVHTASAANTTGWYSEIDSGSTNGQPNAILLVRHDFGAAGPYDDHPVSVFYRGAGAGNRWYVANADQQALADGAAFNVYAQPPSPNAFRVSAMMGASLVVIDHPLVNQVECAQLHVTRVTDRYGSVVSADFAVEYNRGPTYDGYWFIRSPVPFVADTQFDVVIDPAQVQACTDVLFADGFDPAA